MNTRTILSITLVSMLAIFIYTACAPDLVDTDTQGELLPVGIKKFNDGEVSCWVYKDKGISCVKIR